jgi:hypothetical protein
MARASSLPRSFQYQTRPRQPSLSTFSCLFIANFASLTYLVLCLFLPTAIMKFQWLATGAAVAFTVLPATASPARRAPSLFNNGHDGHGDNAHHDSKLRKNNEARVHHGHDKRDYRLSVPSADTQTGAVTEEVTVTTTTTVTGVVPSSSASSSSSSSSFSISRASSSARSSTSTADALSGTSSS